MSAKPKLPAPLTTPDIDCRKLPGFRLNTQRLLSSELWALSTGEEFKAAMALWCRAWQQMPAASLPNDDRVLAAFAGVPRDRWPQVREVAMRGFVLCSDGRLYHPVLAEDARTAHRSYVTYLDGREKDRERLRKWREEQRAKGDGTGTKRVSDGGRNANETLSTGTGTGTGISQEGGEPPAAAAAGVAPPPKAGATPPSKPEAGALGAETPATGAAAAAASKPNPDANAKLRALLGKLGMPASPQAASEWEGFFVLNRITAVSTVRSFLAFCAKRGDVQYPRFVTAELVLEWRGTPT